MRLANQENYALDSFVCDAGTVSIQFNCLYTKGGFKGHLSDDEMVETPMPAGGRVRKMIKHRRQLKAAEVDI